MQIQVKILTKTKRVLKENDVWCKIPQRGTLGQVSGNVKMDNPFYTNSSSIRTQTTVFGRSQSVYFRTKRTPLGRTFRNRLSNTNIY